MKPPEPVWLRQNAGIARWEERKARLRPKPFHNIQHNKHMEELT